MYITYIIISVTALFILFVFFIPLTLDIKISKKGKKVNLFNNNSDKDKAQTNNVFPNSITIKILKIIPMFKIDIDKFKVRVKNKEEIDEEMKNSKDKKDKTLNTVLLPKLLNFIIDNKNEKYRKMKDKIGEYIDKIYIEKLGFSFGFNTGDYVKNAYINASLNSIICLYINYRRKNFNFNRLYYQVYIADYTYYLDLNSIIKVKFADTIYIMIKLAIFNKKELAVDKKEVEEKVWKNTQ